RIDRNPRHADVAGDPRVIAVVAAMGGKIEGDRKALLAGREIAPVEGVGIFGSGKAGILPDRPRLRDVHGRIGAAQIGRDARIGLEEIELRDVFFFKQKTAYEIGLGIPAEPLFRSMMLMELTKRR